MSDNAFAGTVFADHRLDDMLEAMDDNRERLRLTTGESVFVLAMALANTLHAPDGTERAPLEMVAAVLATIAQPRERIVTRLATLCDVAARLSPEAGSRPEETADTSKY